jgi:hypothetical protein
VLMDLLSLLNVRFSLMSLTLEIFMKNINWNMDIIWKDTLIRKKRSKLHVWVMVVYGGYMFL